MTTNPRTTGQEFVSASVHLAGAVEIETGHLARYSAVHIPARIGGVLLYFLDLAAVEAFAEAVAATEQRAARTFAHPHATGLPAALVYPGQDVSLIVRMSGPQATEEPQAMTAAASGDGVARIGCRIGGLRLVVCDAEAMHRLAHVAQSAARLAAALWPHETLVDSVPEPSACADRQPAAY
jgi:hypothetical protein